MNKQKGYTVKKLTYNFLLKGIMYRQNSEHNATKSLLPYHPPNLSKTTLIRQTY